MVSYREMGFSMKCIVVYAMINLWGVCSDKPLSVDPADTRILKGKKLEVVCKHSNSSLQGYLNWLNPNMTSVKEMNSSRITDINGTLTIEVSELGDSGSYTCMHGVQGFNATSEILIYELSDYFATSMIIIGVNAGLVVLFVGCFVFRVIKKKGRRKGKPKAYRRPTL